MMMMYSSVDTGFKKNCCTQMNSYGMERKSIRKQQIPNQFISMK